MKKITFLFFALTALLSYSQQEVLQDFESGGLGDPFGGLASASIVADPEPMGTRGQVAEIIASTAGEVWQGTNINIDQNVELTTDKTMSIDVYSTSAISILVKVTGSGDGGPDSSVEANHTGMGWETITVTFNTGQDNTATANGTYTNFVVYPNWDSAGNGYINPAIARTVYVDNITGTPSAPDPCANGVQDAGEEGIDCGGTCPNACPNPPSGPPTTPPNRAPADVISVFSDAYTDETTEQRQSFGDAVVTELDFSGNAIISATTPLPGAGFQYQYFGSNLDLSAMTHMHIDFYFEGAPTTAGTFFTVIAQYNGGSNAVQNNIDVTALASNTWHEIDVTFDSFASGQPRDQIQQVIVQINGPDIYGPFYVDNIYFHNNTVLSTNDFETSEFKVSPNPTNTDWNLSSSNTITNVAVYDILGKQVLALAPNSNEAIIDASSLRTGVYFARIDGVNGSKTIKLVRE
ncbi:T9SS type A sorting domain-containing protein [Winogradskyella sp.]|uniref:T9SS type A sorting domain-containing protein n=1 Tax=Winogradskyella sp. TaxID=1883156 RepID=UPI00260DD486|nr:T9SS type A sorting domain-containing protein [Winogradskyella sp.]